MNVVHFTSSFSKTSETFIYDLIVELQSLGVENCVITTLRCNQDSRPFDHVLEIPYPPSWNPRRRWNHIRSLVGSSNPYERNADLFESALHKTLTMQKPDILHAHYGPQGVILSRLAAKLRIPLVVSFHGYDVFPASKEHPWESIYEKMFERMGIATVVSKAMFDRLVALGAPRERIRLIHVGKKLNDYVYRKPRGKIENWISIGRFIEKKGFFDCIMSFSRATKGTKAILRIIGQGELLPMAQKLVLESGLSDRILFLGEVQHSMVKKILIDSDAFILCSKTSRSGDKEGIPTVLMEAQALGLPCVSTHHSGIPEVIPQENHWLLGEEGNVESIAECMCRLMACSEEELHQISIKGRKKIEDEFDLATEISKMISCYKQLLRQ